MAETTLRCAQCSALNTPDALQCWRCQSRMQPTAIAPASMERNPDWWRSEAAQAPARAIPAADPDLVQLSAFRTRPRPRRPWMWSLVVVPTLAVVIIGQVRLRGVAGSGGSELPASLAGYTRVGGDPELERVKANFNEGAREYGESVNVAMYRAAGKGLLVEIYAGPSPELTAYGALSQSAQAFQRDGKTTVVMAQQMTAYDKGATLACAPLSGEVSGSLCFWTNFKHLGRVVGYTVDVREAAQLAEAVRHAVDG